MGELPFLLIRNIITTFIYSKKVFLIHPIFFFVVYTGKMVNYRDME